MNLTHDTAVFLLGLLNAQTLNVGADDFEEAAGAVITAHRELLACLTGSEPST